jgi:hypothetical protein
VGRRRRPHPAWRARVRPPAPVRKRLPRQRRRRGRHGAACAADTGRGPPVRGRRGGGGSGGAGRPRRRARAEHSGAPERVGPVRVGATVWRTAHAGHRRAGAAGREQTAAAAAVAADRGLRLLPRLPPPGGFGCRVDSCGCGCGCGCGRARPVEGLLQLRVTRRLLRFPGIQPVGGGGGSTTATLHHHISAGGPRKARDGVGAAARDGRGGGGDGEVRHRQVVPTAVESGERWPLALWLRAAAQSARSQAAGAVGDHRRLRGVGRLLRQPARLHRRGRGRVGGGSSCWCCRRCYLQARRCWCYCWCWC